MHIVLVASILILKLKFSQLDFPTFGNYMNSLRIFKAAMQIRWVHIATEATGVVHHRSAIGIANDVTNNVTNCIIIAIAIQVAMEVAIQVAIEAIV